MDTSVGKLQKTEYIEPQLPVSEDYEEEYDNRGLKLALMIMSLFALVCVTVVVIKLNFTITRVEVTGNEHYTTEEITRMVCSSDLEKNSIFLYLKNRFGGKEKIPFIEQMDVDIVSPTTVKIRVYEKAIAGYVEYLRRTDRAEEAERLIARHPDEL